MFFFFLAKFSLAFLFSRRMSGLHHAVNPLYLLLCSFLFMVALNIDTPTSWRMLFAWLVVVKGFLLTMEIILRSFTTVVFHGRHGLFAFMSSPMLSFVLRMYQTVDFATLNIVAFSRMFFFFCFCSLKMAYFTCMESSFDRMFFSQQNFPNASTHVILLTSIYSQKQQLEFGWTQKLYSSLCCAVCKS